MPENQIPTLLHTHNLSVGYGKQVILDKVNVSIEPGKLIGLIGPNGVGKSTLIRTLGGLQQALSGQVFWKGKDIVQFGKAELAKEMSMVLTDRSPHAGLRVREVLELGRYPYSGFWGKLLKEDYQKIEEAVALSRTAYLQEAYLHELSDGQYQKVMIARALVQDGELIILDEPTAHLDLPNKLDILMLLFQLSRETGKSLLISSHEISLLLDFADHVWLCTCGQLAEQGRPEELGMRGVFDTFVDQERFQWEAATGRVLWKGGNGPNIHLSGTGQNLLWTEKRLRKMGFNLVSGDKESNTHVQVKDKTWEYVEAKETKIFDSLEGLCHHLSANRRDA